MGDERFRREMTKEVYINLYEEEKKALNILNKKIREQSKEITGLTTENVKIKNILKNVKTILVNNKWGELTKEELETNIEKIKRIINRRKE